MLRQTAHANHGFDQLNGAARVSPLLSVDVRRQSVQVAAWPSPALIALAWKLRSYADCSSAWQVAHKTFAGVPSCGALFKSVWQSTQVNIPPWIEFLNVSGLTYKLNGFPLTSLPKVESPWQARH